MKPPLLVAGSFGLLKLPLAVCLLGIVATLPTHAADLYWNASGSGTGTGGTGTWDTSSNRWKTTVGGSSYQAWPTTDPSTSVARFATGSALTIANSTTLYANGLNFGADTSITSGNASSKLVINGTSPTIALSTALAYLNTTVELTGSTVFTSSTASGQILAIGRSTASSTVTGSLTAASGTQTLFTSSYRGTLAVGHIYGATTLGSSTGSVDFGGAQVNANLSALRVGQLYLAGAGGHSTTSVTGTMNFGSNSASTIDIETNLPFGVGLGGGITASITHAGNVTGTMNTQAGTHTYDSLQLNNPVVKIGEMTSDGATNGTNVSTTSGTWNISGGTTTLTPLAGYTPSTYIAVLLANRTATLGANTTVAGTLNLTGGTLTVAGGHIAEANNDAGATSTVTLNGGTLNLSGGNLGLSTGLIDNLNFQSGTLSNVGQINNGAVLNKTTSGTLSLNGTNSYTGGTTLTLGTLQAGSNTAFGSGALNLTAGKLSSDSTTARAISNAVTFGGDVTLGDATNTGGLTFNGAGTLTGNRTITTESNVTYAVAIGETGGARSLTKAGAGSLEFSAVNTYTGTTLVSGGTLILSGSGSIATSTTVDVASGATLSTSGVTFGTSQTIKGNGTISGNTILQGTLAAGNSPGILTFSDDLTLASTTNSIFEIQSGSPVRGTTYDGVNVGDLLTYDGTLTLSMTSLISDGTYNLFDFTSVGGNFDTVVFAGGIYAGTFTHNAGFWTATDTNGSGQTFSFELASGNLSVIPEPSTTLLLAGALTAMIIFRRRRA